MIFILLTGFTVKSQDILLLKDHAPQPVKMTDISWLAGYWTGSGLGGDCEELWLPIADSSLYGVFRFLEKGTLQFTEYMTLIQLADGNIEIRLKHFGRDLTPWEEKEEWTHFRLIKVEGQTAYFDKLTYQRSGKKLTIKLLLNNKEKSWTETFVLKKSGL